MPNKNDEFFHEETDSKDWTESLNINFVSKKNKLYGAADLEYLYDQKQLKLSWIVIFNNIIYENTEFIDFRRKPAMKKIGNNKLEYAIVSPFEQFKLSLKNSSLTADLNITGICPVFDFPENIMDEETGQQFSTKTWNKYEQRCKISGNLSITSGDKKGKKAAFDCFGQREHVWGRINYKDMNCNSRITVQFRDMSMNLTYIENDAVPEYNGFISKRSGNIPIIDVECESLTLNKNMNGMSSTEFSYKDAQDDVDLMVGKSLFSVPVSIEGNRKKKYYRFRNFSEFTIIGSNKKGYGVEEHYFSKEMLNIEDSDEEE